MLEDKNLVESFSSKFKEKSKEYAFHSPVQLRLVLGKDSSFRLQKPAYTDPGWTPSWRQPCKALLMTFREGREGTIGPHKQTLKWFSKRIYFEYIVIIYLY